MKIIIFLSIGAFGTVEASIGCTCADDIARISTKYDGALETVFSRLAALEEGRAKQANRDEPTSAGRNLLAAGNVPTRIDGASVVTRSVEAENVNVATLNITGDMYISGQLYWHNIPVGFDVPTLAPTPPPTPRPSPRPTSFYESASYYGGGWTFVNVPSKSQVDTFDLTAISPGTYAALEYHISSPFNEVLIQRLSAQWCGSWGISSYWVGAASGTGASMGLRADDNYFYYYNNQHGHLWVRQPASYLENGCAAVGCSCYNSDSGHGISTDTLGVTITELEVDGSAVRVHFPALKTQLTVGDFDSLIGQPQCSFGGCNADSDVIYQVFVRATI